MLRDVEIAFGRYFSVSRWVLWTQSWTLAAGMRSMFRSPRCSIPDVRQALRIAAASRSQGDNAIGVTTSEPAYQEQDAGSNCRVIRKSQGRRGEGREGDRCGKAVESRCRRRQQRRLRRQGGKGKGRAITGNITGSTDGLLYDAWFWESCTGTWSMSVWVRDRRGAARALFSLAS